MEKLEDKLELLILEIIKGADEPIGSWALQNMLREKGVEKSAATIGRILNKLELMGYLKKEKFKGRTITTRGLEAIKATKTLNKIDYHKKQLDKFINTRVLKDYLMVLEARKAIEGITAKKAAVHATDKEIQELENILKRQKHNYEVGKSIARTDIDFHKTIAAASGNKVLEALYHIISTFGQQSELFEFIRAKVASPYMISHTKIFNAIKNRDPEEAEKNMIEHIDNLIEDVKKYWHVYYGEENDLEEGT